MPSNVSGPTGTTYKSQHSFNGASSLSTPPSTICWRIVFPSRLAQRKVRMLRFCSSRTTLTAISVLGAGPRISANPGMRPSTNWIPNSRMMVSEM